MEEYVQVMQLNLTIGSQRMTMACYVNECKKMDQRKAVLKELFEDDSKVSEESQG